MLVYYLMAFKFGKVCQSSNFVTSLAILLLSDSNPDSGQMCAGTEPGD